MAVTIKDVAKKANVSPSTVSHVIADHSRISLDTKKRVRRAMKELGYHPNVNARSLAGRSTQAIGVIMPPSSETGFQNSFFSEVLRGVGSLAHEAGYSLYVSTGGDEQQSFEEVKRMVYGSHVDGIILLYSRVSDPVVDFLVTTHFPFILVGKPYINESKITYVDNDNVAASKDITNHLIDLGHQYIGFIGGSTDLVVTVDRLQGYQQAIKLANLPTFPDYIVHAEFLNSGGRKTVKRLFSLEMPPTALVIADDIMSFGVINMLEEIGISCPEDISITGFNNLYLSEITRPLLTTVDIQIFNLGVQAAKCLIEKTKDKEEPAKRIIVPHEIIYRNSTKALLKRV
ncbi:LacI family DNA-binding transcriptional regulator [Amphibacillus cookii]|uniref:LacI family DNA-binding transcriptional regulator n=1 Tax=Amphibacillus cookii TaxID=767787 RepID=UPI001959E1C4|nr:LacI family DNA-binding transcriptional regulator [Amphibacillus cookii]MBM7542326.1 DNA-binding LacI/PurR family transcriptional regulator [Amphibacillus cookii]